MASRDTNTVSLNDILIGNRAKDSTGPAELTSNKEAVNRLTNINTDASDEMSQQWNTMFGGQPHVKPIIRNTNANSLKSLLMQRIPKDKPAKETSIVIPLDGNIKDLAESNITDHKLIEKVDHFDDDLQMLHEGSAKDWFGASHSISAIENSKRTNLKELLGTSIKKNAQPCESLRNNQKLLMNGCVKINRCNEISKLKKLPVLWPELQSICPIDRLEESHFDFIQNRTPPLTELSDKSRNLSHVFDEHDYTDINRKVQDECYEVEETIAIDYKKKAIMERYPVLWPQVMKPKKLSDVLLEPKLKKDVKRWISQAFEHLKRRTTRNKLLNTSKRESRDDDFSAFIVHEDEDGSIPEETNDMLEFVPLMLLYGEGIGKSTLMEVIMTELGGQIYEINSSENRSQKNIKDRLLEYSTSHYVKGKGSKGIIILDDVDVLFKEHDKFFWLALEKVLLDSRRPIVLICKDMNTIPTNILGILNEEGSIFQAKRITEDTLKQFALRYMNQSGMTVSDELMSFLIKESNRDIRKLLITLQFLSATSEPRVKIPKVKTDTTFSSSVHEHSQNLELISNADIINTSVSGCSNLAQSPDPTLASRYAMTKLSLLEDESVRLKNDYMVDYRLHLHDDLYRPQLPFECNVGKYITRNIQLQCKHPSQSCLNSRFNNITKLSSRYVSSRIKPNRHKVKIRHTKNSKRLTKMMANFDGNYDLRPDIEYDDNVPFEFFNKTRETLMTDINAYVCQIAANEAVAKELNRNTFVEYCAALPKENHIHLVNDLLQQGLFKPMWFKEDPNAILKSWE